MPRFCCPYEEARFRGMLWTPDLARSSLEAWYDVMDRSTLTVESGAVSQILDKSGKGRHASQSTADYRPLYSANGWDGVRPAILYNGNSLQHLAVTSNLFQPANLPLMAAAVIDIKDTVSNNSANYVFWGGVGAGSRFFMHRSGFCVNTSFSPFSAATSTVGKTVIIGTRTGTSGELVENGVTTATGGTGTAPTLDTFRLFNYPNGLRQLTDPFAELIIFSANSLPLRWKTLGYLSWKWGCQNNITAAHPFKIRPPMIGD